jgi:hypothetical protein
MNNNRKVTNGRKLQEIINKKTGKIKYIRHYPNLGPLPKAIKEEINKPSEAPIKNKEVKKTKFFTKVKRLFKNRQIKK